MTQEQARAELEAAITKSGLQPHLWNTTDAMVWAWQAARASAPQVVPASDWWRKRADEIELQVAQTGSTEAMRCFTDMRTLLQSAVASQPVAQTMDKSN